VRERAKQIDDAVTATAVQARYGIAEAGTRRRRMKLNGLTSGAAMRTQYDRRCMGAAATLDMLTDMYAPLDEDGARHPEAGMITKDEFFRLLEIL
jgi:hypothetical protein